MSEVTAREIDKLVCDWSSDMLVPIKEYEELKSIQNSCECGGKDIQNSPVRVYKIDWQDGDYNSFVGEVVPLSDYESRITELEEANKRLVEALENIAAQKKFAINTYEEQAFEICKQLAESALNPTMEK